MRAKRYKYNTNNVVHQIDVKLQKRDIAKLGLALVVVEMLLHKRVSEKMADTLYRFKDAAVDKIRDDAARFPKLKETPDEGTENQ